VGFVAGRDRGGQGVLLSRRAGSGGVLAAAGTLVKTVTTDKDGKAVLKNLPLGSYKIVEKTAPDGFVLNSEAQIITFSYKDQETPVIEQTAIFENDRQKVEISVVKQDADTEAAVAGAEFGLYAKR
jgi:uncharacterized surface anchored protein